MILNLNSVQVVSVISHKKRFYDLYFYCKYIFNFKHVYFNSFEGDFFLIDYESINEIEKIENFQSKKFIIFFWNGGFDFFKIKDIANYYKVLLKDNLDFFFVGNSYNNFNRYPVKYFLKNNLNISGVNLITSIDLKYPNLKTIINFLLHPILLIRNICFNKLIFVGSGKVSKNLQTLQNSYKYLSLTSFNLLIEFSNKVIKDKIKFLENLLNEERLDKIAIYELYYLSQVFFRDIFINILIKFKNFKYFDNDKNLSVNKSFLFKKNTFLDLGSKVGCEKIYPRSIYYKIFNKKTLWLNFFDEKEKINLIQIKLKIREMIIFLKSLSLYEKYDIKYSDLIYEINKSFILAKKNNDNF